MENHRKEVSFISQSIIYSVLLGIIVGIAAGLVVVVFRLAIEKLFGVFSHLYPCLLYTSWPGDPHRSY